MIEYRITWNEAGSNRRLRVLFVLAATSDDAREVARDYIERKYGIASAVIRTVFKSEPVPAGTVREG